MSQPAKRTQKDSIGVFMKRQSWVLFALIIFAVVIDVSWLHTQLIVAKSLAMGALLSFSTHAVFAMFVFWYTGYRARGRIVSQLYRGQMIKWLLTVLGFSFIFIIIKPLSPPALFSGFIIMQISHNWMLFRMRL